VIRSVVWGIFWAIGVLVCLTAFMDWVLR